MGENYRAANAAIAREARAAGADQKAAERLISRGWVAGAVTKTGFPKPDRPTSPVHYRDFCAECDTSGVPRLAILCTPHAVEASGDWLRLEYRCPRGHTWMTGHRVVPGYFFDCPCDYCVVYRLEEGVEHRAGVSTYNWLDA